MSGAAGGAGARAWWREVPPRQRRVVQIILGGAVLGLLMVVLLRDPLGRWLWPDPRYDALRQRGESALRAGRLTAADGSGARELFEAALALQPDQLEARDGLARVAAMALARAEARLQAGDYVQARAALQLARELQAPQVRIAPLDARLRAAQARTTGVDALLARAQAALLAGHFDDGEAAALPLYQQVLQAQPRNQPALEGREDALEGLLRPAPAALARGDLAQAVGLLRRAEAFDPGYPGLPALHAGVARALEAQERGIRQQLARGRVEAAAQACQRLGELELPPPSGVCGAPLGEALLRAADAAVADFRFDAARQWLAAASAAGVAADRVQQVDAHLRRARQDAMQLPQATARSGRSSVPKLLKQAAHAQAQGHWLTPPGASAWDALHAAQALAPRDPRVQAASRAMLAAARQCHATALRDNNLGRARACLDAWRQLSPDDAGVLAARRRLAARWLAVGDDRLGGGDVRGAREALQRARDIDAAVPGIDVLAERLARTQSPAQSSARPPARPPAR